LANDLQIKRLIFVPTVITLAVTLLRLVGELLRWSPVFFNRTGGGLGAIVGIVWLVPIFGVYFGLKLADASQGPAGGGRAVGYSLLGFAIPPAVAFLGIRLGLSPQSFLGFGVFIVLWIIGSIVAYLAWPPLGKTLLAYALAARIPVVIVMLFAILWNWGTHYDAPPERFPEMSPIARWIVTGVLPQLTLWVWFTIVVGILFGAIALAATGRARRQVAA